MYLAGVVLGIGAHILLDTGAMHNVININFARLMPSGILQCPTLH
jgi:hypothetical protein